jgi:PhnB protein
MFADRADEAIAFYQKAVGAQITMVMRFEESPDKNHPMPIPANLGQKIMHAATMVGSTLLMTRLWRAQHLPRLAWAAVW